MKIKLAYARFETWWWWWWCVQIRRHLVERRRRQKKQTWINKLWSLTLHRHCFWLFSNWYYIHCMYVWKIISCHHVIITIKNILLWKKLSKKQKKKKMKFWRIMHTTWIIICVGFHHHINTNEWNIFIILTNTVFFSF